MTASPFEPAVAERARRRRRALGVAALALVAVAAAGFVYLRSNNTLTTAGVPSSKPLPTGRNPVKYFFVSPSLGWAATSPFGSSSPPGQFRVFKTVDGAKNWQEQIEGQSKSPGFTPIKVQFFDQTHGYMTVDVAFIGEQVYRTSDRGNHWQPVKSPAPQTVEVIFSDAARGWALAQDQAEATTGQLFDLYVTNDGGTSWERLPDPPGDAYYFAFREPTEAWMGSLGKGPPHLYTSADVGRTWVRHDLPPPPGQSWDIGGHGTTVQLLPQAGAVATTGVNTSANVSEAMLFSSDGIGGDWRYVPPPPGAAAYQDRSHWWAIKDTVLSKSSDGGQTWSRITDTLPDWQFVPHILDAKHAWAELTVAGGYGLALTNDGGLHWTRSNVPNEQQLSGPT